jgi:NitT/TauT family transport system ATP-binding protein
MSKTLEVRGLNKAYQGPGRSVEALRDLTLAVEASELVCVVGHSGCGKTTMLRCVAGLLEPTAGAQIQQAKRGGHPGQLTAGR